MVKLNSSDDNFNKYQNSFSKLSKGSDEMINNDVVFKKIVMSSNKLLSDISERQVPENGQFKSVSIDYNIPDSTNMAKVTIECDKEYPKTQRRISVGVHHQDRDRLISNYMFKGTKKEVLAYLTDEKNQTEFFNTIKKLSEKTDEYYENL